MGGVPARAAGLACHPAKKIGGPIERTTAKYSNLGRRRPSRTCSWSRKPLRRRSLKNAAASVRFRRRSLSGCIFVARY